MFCGTLVGSSCATVGPSTYENSKPSAGTSNAFGATVKDTAPASCAGAVQRASEAAVMDAGRLQAEWRDRRVALANRQGAGLQLQLPNMDMDEVSESPRVSGESM